MGQAKARKVEIEKMKKLEELSKGPCEGFDIFFDEICYTPEDFAEIIKKVGEWASNAKGLGFKGKHTIRLSTPNSPDHPSPKIHGDHFAVTYMWDQSSNINSLEGLQRLRYILTDDNDRRGYDGAEFYKEQCAEFVAAFREMAE